MGETSMALLPVSCVQEREGDMSDNYNEPSDDGDEDFKNLRAKAKKADQIERENVSLKRELAFVKAGIPMDDPKVGYFVKGYDGELDPQAIRSAAEEAGFIQAPTQQEDPAVQQAQQGQQRVMAAASGAEPQFDPVGIQFGMEQAVQQGGLEGLSAYTQQYGVTFNPEPVK
jgi:hypothetical protein